MEPIIIRARKYLAFLAPDSGAAPAEREAAGLLLHKLLTEHGLTMADVTEQQVHPASIIVADSVEATVVVQIAAWIKGTKVRVAAVPETVVTTLKNGRKRWKVMKRVTVDMTTVEHADWLAAWSHYQPEFAKTRKTLNDAVRAARRAEKHAAAGFVHRHSIFPPTSPDAKPSTLTPEELQAVKDALRASTGNTWSRPAGTIGDGLALMG